MEQLGMIENGWVPVSEAVQSGAPSGQGLEGRVIHLDAPKETDISEAGPDDIIVLEISDEAATKAKGLALRGWLERLLSLGAGNIAVNFRRVARFAYPFFNYSFAALALVHGFDAIRAVQIRNISQVGLAAYQASMENAEMVSRHPGHIVEANQIIDDAPKKVVPQCNVLVLQT